jgi:hypothetical protein
MNIIQFPKPKLAINKHPKFRIDKLMEDVYTLIVERLDYENLLPSEDHEEFIEDLGWAMSFTRCSLYSLIDQEHDLEEFSELVKLQYKLIKESGGVNVA